MFDKTVGEAYVLMRADGRLLKRDIKDLGRNAGSDWGAALQKEMDAANKITIKRFQQQMSKGFAEMDFSGFLKEFGTVDDTVEGLGTRLEEMRRRGKLTDDQFTKLAESVIQWGEENRDRLAALDVAFDDSKIKAVRRLRTEIAEARRTGDFSRMLKQFGSIEGVLEGVNSELFDMRRTSQVSNRLFAETSHRLQEWADDALRVRKQHELMTSSLVRYGDVFNRTVKKQWTDLAEQIVKASNSGDFSHLREEGESTEATIARLNDTLVNHRRELVLVEDEYDHIVRKMSEWSVKQNEVDKGKALTDLLDGITRRRHPVVQALDNVDERTGALADGIGRAFGKGSRNDFLNFVGSFVGGMSRLITSVPTSIIKTITGVGAAFKDGFSAARLAGLGRFASAGKGIASIFTGKGGVIGAVVGAAVAAIAFGKALPAIASAVSMLAANAISLVGSVGVGLAGAFLALVPAVVAAAGAIPILIGAFKAFDNSDEGKEWALRQKAAFDEFYKTLFPAVRRFKTLFSEGFLGLGEAVQPGIDNLSRRLEKLFDEKDTQGRLKQWGDSIKRMLADLSPALTDLTDGLIAFFIPILPYAEKLTEAIKDMADRFADWATSASGQNSIADFMERAWDAATALWDLLTELTSLIGTVFDIGADETGTGWIQGWADAVADFNAFLKSPEGSKALKDWFADAKEFGEDVGRIIGDVAKAFDELDSPEGRKTATTIASAIKDIADLAVNVASAADDVGRIVDTIGSLVVPKVLYDLLVNGKLPDFEIVPEETNDAVQAKFDEIIASVEKWGQDLNDSLDKWFSDAWEATTQWVEDTWTTISEFFTTLPENISTWVTETREAFVEGLTQMITDALDGLATGLENFATAITEFDLSDFLMGVLEGIGTFFNDLGTAIAENFTAMVESIGTWITETWDDFTSWASGVYERIVNGLEATPGAIETWATETLATIGKWVSDTWADFTEWAGRIPGLVADGFARLGTFLSELPGRIAAWLSSVPDRLSQPFRDAWASVNRTFDNAPSRLAGAIGSVLSAIGGRLSGVWETITGPFRRAWAEVQRLIGNITNISLPGIGNIDLTPWNAAGNIYSGPTVIGVGEAGREAVVPLDRPLSMVNPNVRALSAIAQGKATMATSGGSDSRIVVQEGAVQVTSRATDPYVVGSIVVDAMADAIASATGH